MHKWFLAFQSCITWSWHSSSPKNFNFFDLFIILFSFSSFALSLMVCFNTSSILSCTTRTVAGRSGCKLKWPFLKLIIHGNEGVMLGVFYIPPHPTGFAFLFPIPLSLHHPPHPIELAFSSYLTRFPPPVPIPLDLHQPFPPHPSPSQSPSHWISPTNSIPSSLWMFCPGD